MRTASMSLEEYKAEQAERNLSADDRVKRLTGGSEQLRTRDWSDKEIMAIPDDLLGLAYEQSATLQEEFGSLSALVAYRRAVGQGKVRSAGVRK
jgi:hypothetical protein